jgi:hypothetical protein
MKKSLFATVAAIALIAGAGLASAQSSKEQPSTSAGAPVKSEPEMKKGADVKSRSENKAEPGARVDNKADTGRSKPSTTGQSSEPRSAPAGRSTTDEKSAPSGRSNTNEKAPARSSTQGTQSPSNNNSAQGTQSPSNNSAQGTQNPSNNSAQGTQNPSNSAAQSNAPSGASVNLTPDQKSTIRTTVLQSSGAPKVSRSQINFNISVGTVVPRSVRFVTVPDTIVRIHPAWRGYSYFVVDEEIIIIEPKTLKIVAVLTV